MFPLQAEESASNIQQVRSLDQSPLMFADFFKAKSFLKNPVKVSASNKYKYL